MRLGTRLAFTLLTLLASAPHALPQDSKAPSPAAAAPPAAQAAKRAVASSPAALALARAALKALGGDSFLKMTSLVIHGGVDITGPSSVQALPAKFVIITSGESCRVDLQTPLFRLQQVYDGRDNFVNLPGMNMPPLTKFGLNLLTKLDVPGYSVTELPEKKRQKGFRITDPEGSFTDFYMDATSGQIVSYTIHTNLQTAGGKVSQVELAIEHKKMQMVDGVLVPFVFSQRIDTPQGSFFAEYKVKAAKLNQPISSKVFTVPKPR